MHDQSSSHLSTIDALARQGLNLFAVFELSQLPDSIFAVLEQSDLNLAEYSRLVLLGNGGRRFWDELGEAQLGGSHPIDTYSLRLTDEFIRQISAADDNSLIVYPQSDMMVPLQQLGQLAGWGTPSPIGNSISPEYGLWFAFRAAFLTSVELSPTKNEQRPSPCLTCVDKPCQTACPAGAVQETSATFKLHNCITHRLEDGSSCAATCLARVACPVAPEHRYPAFAIRYLYSTSLQSIHKWQAKK